MVSMDESKITDEMEPLLLGAVPIKSELIEEVQMHYNFREIFQVVMNQWRAVMQTVQEADQIVVVGYSFPKEDQYGRFLFREAIRQRTKPLKVEFYEVEHRVAERADCILTALQMPGIQLEWKGKVEPPKL
jgi:hypothetical protein